MHKNEINQKLRIKYEEIWQAFGGYFNQDTESFEKGLSELTNNSKEWLQVLKKNINEFVEDSKFTLEEKKFFITENVALSFDFHKMEPLNWLQDVAQQIEEHLKKN